MGIRGEGRKTHREVYEYRGKNRRKKISERRGTGTMGIVRERRKTGRSVMNTSTQYTFMKPIGMHSKDLPVKKGPSSLLLFSCSQGGKDHSTTI